MDRTSFVVKPGERDTALDVLGTRVTVLAAAPRSADHRITLQSGGEGMGPPPHSHAWDESFFVSGGQIAFTCDGETTLCDAGTFVHVPAGTVHSFAYGPDGGEMIEITGGQSHAVEMFTALDALPAGPPDVAKAVEVLGAHGVTVHV